MAFAHDGSDAPDGGGPAGDPTPDDDTRAVGEPAGVRAAQLAAELALLKGELEEEREESAKRLDGWQRSQAELDNYKKWALQEMADRIRGAKASVLLDLLDVVDDFERALAADHETDPHAWIEGVRLIERKFYRFLEQHQLSPIAAEAQRFDPHFHDAMGEAPGPAGQVIAQLQKGYLMGEKVLRPSRVIVGSGQPPAQQDAPAEEPASPEANPNAEEAGSPDAS